MSRRKPDSLDAPRPLSVPRSSLGKVFLPSREKCSEDSIPLLSLEEGPVVDPPALARRLTIENEKREQWSERSSPSCC